MAGYGATTTNGGEVITIPAGQAWAGNLILAGSLAGAIGGGGAVATPSATLEEGGTGLEPPAGSVLTRLSLSSPAIGALSLVGTATSDSVCSPSYYIYNGTDTAAKIKLNTGGATSASLVAMGIIQ